MADLLQSRFLPTTLEIGFIEAPAYLVADVFVQWQMDVNRSCGVIIDRQNVTGTLGNILMYLQPLTSIERRRFLLVPTQSKWTAFFDNGWQGTDAAAPMSYLARKIGCRAVRSVAITQNMKTEKSKYPAVIFELYGPEDTDFLNYIRSVSVANDGGSWAFSATGQVLSFERPDNYDQHKKRDRFTIPMLDEYLQALGIRAFEEKFYETSKDAILLRKSGPMNPAAREYRMNWC